MPLPQNIAEAEMSECACNQPGCFCRNLVDYSGNICDACKAGDHYDEMDDDLVPVEDW